MQCQTDSKSNLMQNQQNYIQNQEAMIGGTQENVFNSNQQQNLYMLQQQNPQHHFLRVQITQQIQQQPPTGQSMPQIQQPTPPQQSDQLHNHQNRSHHQQRLHVSEIQQQRHHQPMTVHSQTQQSINPQSSTQQSNQNFHFNQSSSSSKLTTYLNIRTISLRLPNS